MKRGEIWWAELAPPVGRRPVVILTRDAAVSVRNQVVVAQVTRSIHHLPVEVSLDRSDGMPKVCVINCDVLLTVPKSHFISRIIQLSPQKMLELEAAIKHALDIH